MAPIPPSPGPRVTHEYFAGPTPDKTLYIGRRRRRNAPSPRRAVPSTAKEAVSVAGVTSADTAVIRTAPESVCTAIAAASGKVIRQVFATPAVVQVSSNMPKNDKLAIDEPVKKLKVSSTPTEPMIASFIGLPVATTAAPMGRSIAQSALEHGVPGGVVFSPRPLSAKELAGGASGPPVSGFRVKAPPGAKGSSKPVAVKVSPKAVNDCVFGQT